MIYIIVMALMAILTIILIPLVFTIITTLIIIRALTSTITESPIEGITKALITRNILNVDSTIKAPGAAMITGALRGAMITGAPRGATITGAPRGATITGALRSVVIIINARTSSDNSIRVEVPAVGTVEVPEEGEGVNFKRVEEYF
jgi:hypothetical protein